MITRQDRRLQFAFTDEDEQFSDFFDRLTDDAHEIYCDVQWDNIADTAVNHCRREIYAFNAFRSDGMCIAFDRDEQHRLLSIELGCM